MITQAVEEAVGISRDSRRCQSNQRTQLRRRTFQRKLVEQTAVHIGVEGGIVLQQVGCFALDGNAFGSPSYLDGDFQAKRYGGVHLHILGIWSEPSHGDAEVVTIEWSIGKTEASRAIGGGCSVILADRVVNFDGCIRHYRAGRIGDDAAQR